MKSFLFLFLFVSFSLQGQQSITKSITHDGIERSYIVYEPANFAEVEDNLPVVLNFHGYGSNAEQQQVYGDFRFVADTAGFLIVHPLGTVYQGSTHWNVGSWVDGSPAEDVDFTAALLDQLEADYNINKKRVYATGMSNGGFFSFLLACQLSDRIAAIASVTGSMTPNNLIECDPQRPVPIMQIHGTIDPVVPYGGANFTKPVLEAVEYWRYFNNCDVEPITFDLPNVNALDGSTATFFRYDNCDQDTDVEHIRINGGQHTWPGTVFVTPGTNLDFIASDAIWQFFIRYELQGAISTNTGDIVADDNFSVYPTISSNYLTIKRSKKIGGQYMITDIDGRVVVEGTMSSNSEQLDIDTLAAGKYYITIDQRVQSFIKI